MEIYVRICRGGVGYLAIPVAPIPTPAELSFKGSEIRREIMPTKRSYKLRILFPSDRDPHYMPCLVFTMNRKFQLVLLIVLALGFCLFQCAALPMQILPDNDVLRDRFRRAILNYKVGGLLMGVGGSILTEIAGSDLSSPARTFIADHPSLGNRSWLPPPEFLKLHVHASNPLYYPGIPHHL